MKTLLIVESPAKAKTIEKLLGPNYVVKSSFGHIRDLVKDKNDFGIDIENGFRPKYKIMTTRTKQISDINDTIKKVDRVLLAADEDREGEAIAWHCAVVFKLNVEESNRICFHEITKKALEESVANPRKIDMGMVFSQQARRILDRLVGFELSPILWKHVKPELSAGRVQSVSLKIIVDKEKEFDAFMDKKYFKTIGHFKKILGNLNKNFENSADVSTFLDSCRGGVVYTVESMDSKKNEKRPPPPYVTSSIQQDLGSRFGIPAKKIMSILQNLYEGGLITYHRTDSTNLSDFAQGEAKKYIIETLGKEYFHPRIYKTKSKSAQEAHEAIRPTYFSKMELEGDDFSEMDKKVYALIWKRTVASQMSPYIYEIYTMTIGISGRDEKYIAKAEKMIFEGYKKIYQDFEKKDGDGDEDVISPIFGNIKVGDTMVADKVVSVEKYLNPPPRYTEASLIKKMELLGIGRPSTYANIIETILNKNYVQKKDIEGRKIDGESFVLEKGDVKKNVIKISIGAEKKKLIPTEIGKVTLGFLEKNFENIVNYQFTSNMELKLDEVASGGLGWVVAVGEFYSSFHPQVEVLKKTSSMKGETSGKRLVGNNSEDIPVYAYLAKYGPVLQIGDDTDKGKRYVKLDEQYSINTVSMKDVEKIIQFPKTLGKHNGLDILVKNGMYGFYMTHGGKNYKIPEGHNEYLSLEDAVEIIGGGVKTGEDGEASETSVVNTSIKSIGKYQIRNGKFGPYILYDKKFFSIGKDYNPAELTEEDCKKIVSVKKKKFVKNEKTEKKSETI
jgi:DNA topoisomerase-1